VRVAAGAAALIATACVPGDVERHSQSLAPGIWHHSVYLVRGPWRINVVEIDLERAWAAGYRLRTASAADGGLARVSELGAQALAAINGDFFAQEGEQGRALGLQIRNGCLLRPPVGRSALVIDSQGRCQIGRFQLRAELLDDFGVSYSISAYGRAPRPEELSLFSACTALAGDTVRAAVGLQLLPLGEGSAINDTVPVLVRQIRRQAWPLLLDRGHWLAAAGSRHPAGQLVAPGDTLGLCLHLVPEDGLLAAGAAYEEAIGGGPRLLRDGQVAVEYAAERLSEAFAAERHPRTAAGYTRDGAVLYLVVVDGRQPGYSAGMSLTELASFMGGRLGAISRSGLPAHQALNFDGGGSTTMVVNRRIVNSPSDRTGERQVANALLVVGPERSW